MPTVLESTNTLYCVYTVTVSSSCTLNTHVHVGTQMPCVSVYMLAGSFSFYQQYGTLNAAFLTNFIVALYIIIDGRTCKALSNAHVYVYSM